MCESLSHSTIILSACYLQVTSALYLILTAIKSFLLASF